MRFSTVILAGGRSQRMRRDKALLTVDGQSLLHRQIELVRQRGAEEIFVSRRPDAEYAVPGCSVLHDRFADAGPLGGIERALERLQSPLLLVLAVDMPHINAEILGELELRCTGGAGVIPRVGGRCEPLAAFYPKAAGQVAGAMLTAGFKAATMFAEKCVQSGLANFYELESENTRRFISWNRPEDIGSHFDLPGAA